MKEAHLHWVEEEGGRVRVVLPTIFFIKTDTWLGNNDRGLVIGKPPWQRALSPTVLPKLLACQSPHHAPLWCRGKWVVGVGPLITSSREHRPPWGMRRVTLLSSLNKIFICYFFPSWLDNSIPSLGGEHAHHPSVAELAKICPSLQVKQRGVRTVYWFTNI